MRYTTSLLSKRLTIPIIAGVWRGVHQKKKGPHPPNGTAAPVAYLTPSLLGASEPKARKLFPEVVIGQLAQLRNRRAVLFRHLPANYLRLPANRP